MMKVATIVGTRPEIIRLSRVIAALEDYTDHVLIHTGQNYDYELNEIFFHDLEISPPNFFLDAAGSSPAETIGHVIARSYSLLQQLKPDAVLILGDTNSCLAAISAKRLKIPVFHMEAGNRSFDQRVPEEINRKIVDHISDVNLPYSQISREYLLREGFPPDRIIVTGSPLFEVFQYYRSKIATAKILERLNLEPFRYYLVSCHREENVDDPRQFQGLVRILRGLASMGMRVIVTAHPRTRRRFEDQQDVLPAEVELHRPFAFTEYVKLQENAAAVLSDSGTITEEASILNLRALNIRQTHERPEGMEEAVVMLVGMSWERVREGLSILERQKRGDERLLRIVRDYTAPNVSEKVVRIIMSYTDYVNRFVWHKGRT